MESQVNSREDTKDVRSVMSDSKLKEKPADTTSDANVSGLIHNIENETQSDLKLEKSVKSGQWDMFADQDNFSIDVSLIMYCISIKYKVRYLIVILSK